MALMFLHPLRHKNQVSRSRKQAGGKCRLTLGHFWHHSTQSGSTDLIPGEIVSRVSAQPIFNPFPSAMSENPRVVIGLCCS